MNKRWLPGSTLLNISSILVAVLFGFWGLELSLASLRLSEAVSKQEQKIKGFETLLSYSRNQIDTLSYLTRLQMSELQILTGQSKISRENLRVLNSQTIIGQKNLQALDTQLIISQKNRDQNILSEELTTRYQAQRLLATAQSLMFYTADFNSKRFDSASRQYSYNYIGNLLNSELSNAFLISNEALYRRWTKAIEVIQVNKQIDHFFNDPTYPVYQIKEGHAAWLRRIFDLSADVIDYFTRYYKVKVLKTR